MRNVKRVAKPSSLSQNANKWKRELLDEMKKGTSSDKKKLSRLQNRYNCPDVRQALASMYMNKCCYCESNIMPVAKEHIEHRKPKKKFPKSTFDWNNLHLACPRCNESKGEQWDGTNDILDAVIDVPIKKHLTYKIYWVDPLTPRGVTTKEHARLNRDDLLEARRSIFDKAHELIEECKKKPNDPRVTVVRDQLKLLAKGQYGTLIQYLVDLHLP